MKLDFLTSRRFWSLVAIAILKVLDTEGILPYAVSDFFVTILAGFIGIRTIDKATENLK